MMEIHLCQRVGGIFFVLSLRFSLMDKRGWVIVISLLLKWADIY